MEIEWEVDDGYVGGSRPHTTTIPDSDFEYMETEDEKQTYIEECVQADYEQRISWYIKYIDGEAV